ncbi:MAG TPA: TetR/AcrR family transcriptional regulator [Bacteroidia bacterium]
MQVKITKSALTLFYKHGIKRVTMDDIAKEMGISKKTIYRFFHDKDALVNLLFETELKKNQLHIEEIHQQAKDPIHESVLIAQYLQKMFADINPVFFHDLHKQSGQALMDFNTFKRECMFNNLKRNITEGVKLGLYRSDLDIDFVAQYRVVQMDMFMTKVGDGFENMSMARAHQLIMDIFMHGIATVKGHKLINKYKNKTEEE